MRRIYLSVTLLSLLILFALSCTTSGLGEEEKKSSDISSEISLKQEPITFIDKFGNVLNEVDIKAKESQAPYFCLVSTLTDDNYEWAYGIKKYGIYIPENLLEDSNVDTEKVTFRIAAKDAQVRESADPLISGGVVRQARCLLPDSDSIIHAVKKELARFDKSSWFYNNVANEDNKEKSKSMGWVYACTAVYDHFYCDRPNVVNPYNDPGCVYVGWTCAEYSWIFQEEEDDPFGGGGGTSSADPCEPCDPSGIEPCSNQEGEAPSFPESCSIYLDISLLLDPCKLADLLEDDLAFRSYMALLNYEADNENFESGYYFKNTSSGKTFDYFRGADNEHDINFSPPYSLDGLIHQHYNFNSAESAFSADDVLALYLLLTNGSINNPETFTMGLTTHFDTSYLLKIDDLNAFLSFGQENFGSEDDWTDFGTLWGGLRNTYIYNLQMGEIQGGKLAMAEMLDDSGLKIFEGNSNFTSWQAIKINSSGTGTENDNCN